ncbi:hypothetical protein GCM10009565_52800 [Amycolatopsis albidoflavus]
MVSPGVCEYCERRCRLKKDGSGLRVMHYVNVTGFLMGNELRPCRGADPDGVVPSWAVVQDGKKWGIKCPGCGQRVPQSKRDFRPLKHAKPGTKRDCPGYTANKRSR